MEGELWKQLYQVVMEVSKNWPRRRKQYSDAWIVLTYLWAVLHDRPTCWACRLHSWP